MRLHLTPPRYTSSLCISPRPDIRFLQNPITGIVSAVSSLLWPAEEKLCYPFLAKLAESGRPIEELAGQALGVTLGSTVSWAQCKSYC